MKNIRKNSEKGWLTFYSGAIAGLSLGLIISPIWWIVDTIGIILHASGTLLSKTGAVVRGRAEKKVKEGPAEKLVTPVTDVDDGATTGAA